MSLDDFMRRIQTLNDFNKLRNEVKEPHFSNVEITKSLIDSLTNIVCFDFKEATLSNSIPSWSFRLINNILSSDTEEGVWGIYVTDLVNLLKYLYKQCDDYAIKNMPKWWSVLKDVVLITAKAAAVCGVLRTQVLQQLGDRLMRLLLAPARSTSQAVFLVSQLNCCLMSSLPADHCALLQYKSELGQLVASCGDYVLQLSLMEMHALLGLSRPQLPQHPGLDTLAPVSTTTGNFDDECRIFLNAVNRVFKKVISLPAEQVIFGNREKPTVITGNPVVWVDWNGSPYTLSLVCEPLLPSPYSGMLDTLTLSMRDISSLRHYIVNGSQWLQADLPPEVRIRSAMLGNHGLPLGGALCLRLLPRALYHGLPLGAMLAPVLPDHLTVKEQQVDAGAAGGAGAGRGAQLPGALPLSQLRNLRHDVKISSSRSIRIEQGTAGSKCYVASIDPQNLRHGVKTSCSSSMSMSMRMDDGPPVRRSSPNSSGSSVLQLPAKLKHIPAVPFPKVLKKREFHPGIESLPEEEAEEIPPTPCELDAGLRLLQKMSEQEILLHSEDIIPDSPDTVCEASRKTFRSKMRGASDTLERNDGSVDVNDHPNISDSQEREVEEKDDGTSNTLTHDTQNKKKNGIFKSRNKKSFPLPQRDILKLPGTQTDLLPTNIIEIQHEKPVDRSQKDTPKLSMQKCVDLAQKRQPKSQNETLVGSSQREKLQNERSIISSQSEKLQNKRHDELQQTDIFGLQNDMSIDLSLKGSSQVVNATRDLPVGNKKERNEKAKGRKDNNRAKSRKVKQGTRGAGQVPTEDDAAQNNQIKECLETFPTEQQCAVPLEEVEESLHINDTVLDEKTIEEFFTQNLSKLGEPLAPEDICRLNRSSSSSHLSLVENDNLVSGHLITVPVDVEACESNKARLPSVDTNNEGVSIKEKQPVTVADVNLEATVVPVENDDIHNKGKECRHSDTAEVPHPQNVAPIIARESVSSDADSMFNSTLNQSKRRKLFNVSSKMWHQGDLDDGCARIISPKIKRPSIETSAISYDSIEEERNKKNGEKKCGQKQGRRRVRNRSQTKALPAEMRPRKIVVPKHDAPCPQANYSYRKSSNSTPGNKKKMDLFGNPMKQNNTSDATNTLTAPSAGSDDEDYVFKPKAANVKRGKIEKKTPKRNRKTDTKKITATRNTCARNTVASLLLDENVRYDAVIDSKLMDTPDVIPPHDLEEYLPPLIVEQIRPCPPLDDSISSGLIEKLKCQFLNDSMYNTSINNTGDVLPPEDDPEQNPDINTDIVSPPVNTSPHSDKDRNDYKAEIFQNVALQLEQLPGSQASRSKNNPVIEDIEPEATDDQDALCEDVIEKEQVELEETANILNTKSKRTLQVSESGTVRGVVIDPTDDGTTSSGNRDHGDVVLSDSESGFEPVTYLKIESIIEAMKMASHEHKKSLVRIEHKPIEILKSNENKLQHATNRGPAHDETERGKKPSETVSLKKNNKCKEKGKQVVQSVEQSEEETYTLKQLKVVLTRSEVNTKNFTRRLGVISEEPSTSEDNVSRSASPPRTMASFDINKYTRRLICPLQLPTPPRMRIETGNNKKRYKQTRIRHKRSAVESSPDTSVFTPLSISNNVVRRSRRASKIRPRRRCEREQEQEQEGEEDAEQEESFMQWTLKHLPETSVEMRKEADASSGRGTRSRGKRQSARKGRAEPPEEMSSQAMELTPTVDRRERVQDEVQQEQEQEREQGQGGPQGLFLEQCQLQRLMLEQRQLVARIGEINSQMEAILRAFFQVRDPREPPYQG